MTQAFFLMAMLLPPVAVAFFVVKEWKRAVLAAAIVLFGAVWWEARGISLHRYFARTVHSSMEKGCTKDHAALQRMFRDARAGDREVFWAMLISLGGIAVLKRRPELKPVQENSLAGITGK